MSRRIKVKNLIKTCDAFPAQWEGSSKAGHFIYIRYRNNLLEVYKSKKKAEEFSLDDKLLLLLEISANADLSTKDMTAMTKSVLDFSECKYYKELLVDDLGIII